MLRTIINFSKKLLTAIIFSAMLLSMFPREAHADYSENETRKVDVVVRAGEWGNKEAVKPGKRYNWGSNINISEHGISAKDIPSDIPLRCENNQWFISEFDINLKLSKAIAKKLAERGVNVNLQYATSKSQDLNAAGRIASKCDPKIYLSVHHNSFKDDSTGYFFMSNRGDTNSSIAAKKLADSMNDNGLIPQKENRANDGYIGELNKVATNGRISILGEFGFFNKAEIVKICSDEYVDYVSTKVADSIKAQLDEMNLQLAKETDVMKIEQPKVIGIKRNNTKEVKEPEMIVLKFHENDYIVTNEKLETEDVVRLSFVGR